jgi:hypothetical protein
LDFILSKGFQKVEQTFATRQIRLGAEKESEVPVSLNLTLNSSPTGEHRLIVKRYDTAKEMEIPAAKLPFGALDEEDDLEFRQTLHGFHQGLNKNLGKRLDDFKRDLVALAHIGAKYYYERVFTKIDVEGDVMSGANWWMNLEAALSAPAIIEVARTGSANYAFPWSLVYEYRVDHDPDFCPTLDEWSSDGVRQGTYSPTCPHEADHRKNGNVICPYGFWGLKHIIEQPLSDDLDQSPHSPNKRIVLASDKIVLGIAITDDLDKETLNYRDKHIAELHNLANICIRPDKGANTIEALFEMLKTPELVYFLCHGAHKDGKPYLVIGDTRILDNWIGAFFWMDHRDSIDINAWGKQRPLVFLNACHSTEVPPTTDLTFLETFRALNANGIIGTEVSMLAIQAMEIGKIILGKLTQGERVGDAIRDMRWELVNKGNLLGLAYTPMGLPT